MYTAKELLKKIVNDLMKDSYLSQFKLRKSDCFLYIKEGDLRKSIELEHWADILDLSIRPSYGVKFESLTKWFEKFSVKTIKDQRDNCDEGFQEIKGLSRGWMGIYTFRKDGEGYDEAITILRQDLVICSKFTFDMFDSLEKLFNVDITPLLNGTRKLGVCDLGADWIFRYLRLCQLVSPKDYPKLKEILIEHFNFMKNRDEPNITKYVDKINSILDYLETIGPTK